MNDFNENEINNLNNTNEIDATKEYQNIFSPLADEEMLKEKKMSKKEAVIELNRAQEKLTKLRFAHGNPEMVQEKKKYYMDQANTLKTYIKENYYD